MHLDHKVPWNLVCSHLKVFQPPPPEEQSRYPPRLPDLRARNQSRQCSDLNHFARVLASVIREFSATERRKYSTEELDSFPSDKICTDTWRDDHIDQGDILEFSPEMQRFSVWVKQCRYYPSPYAASVKALLDPQGLDAQKNMMNLLRLARRPEINFRGLDHCGQNCEHGVSAIAEITLQTYIYLNVVGCLPAEQRQNIQMWECNSKVVLATMSSRDYSSQQILHHRFWSHSCCWDENDRHLTRMRKVPYYGHIDWFADMSKLKDYLSVCFEMLVRYDCVMKEAGLDVDWVQLIIDWTPLPFDKKLVYTGEEHFFKYQFTDYSDPTGKTVEGV